MFVLLLPDDLIQCIAVFLCYRDRCSLVRSARCHHPAGKKWLQIVFRRLLRRVIRETTSARIEWRLTYSNVHLWRRLVHEVPRFRDIEDATMVDLDDLRAEWELYKRGWSAELLKTDNSELAFACIPRSRRWCARCWVTGGCWHISSIMEWNGHCWSFD